jgi:hypothetical protein
MPGLDPGIHRIFVKESFEEDGSPGQSPVMTTLKSDRVVAV